MKIYIAGPITGIFNYRGKFQAAEEELKAKGHIVLNPSFLPDGLKDYMPTCKAMIDQADALYMLKGYQNSVGTTEELEYARKYKKKIFLQRNNELQIGTSIDLWRPIKNFDQQWVQEVEKNIKRLNRRRGLAK